MAGRPIVSSAKIARQRCARTSRPALNTDSRVLDRTEIIDKGSNYGTLFALPTLQGLARRRALRTEHCCEERIRVSRLALIKIFRTLLPVAIQWFAGGCIFFLLGMLSGRYGAAHFPYTWVRAAWLTADNLWQDVFDDVALDDTFLRFSKFNLADVRRQRIVAVGPEKYSEDLIFTGGPYSFREYCPKHGCLAVELGRDGRLVHAYPLRYEGFITHRTVDLPYAEGMNSLKNQLVAQGIAKLDNGDLIVVMKSLMSYPWGGGVARVRPDGEVVWFRRDYTHHWPTILDSKEIAVTSLRDEKSPLVVPITSAYHVAVPCRDQYYKNDIIRILGVDGSVREEFSVVDALIRSPFRAILVRTFDGCDPTHLNFVQYVGRDLAAHIGVSPTDFLVSMRHVSGFGIIDHKTHNFIRFYVGNFALQHAVQPFKDCKVIMVDNWGTDGISGPSRLLSYDLCTHTEETIFPKPADRGRRVFTFSSGTISLSHDRLRAIVTFSEAGLGYEVDLSTGRILSYLRNLQDLRSARSLSEERLTKAGVLDSQGIYYAR